MKTSEGKIGIREYIAIITFILGTKITDDTPTIILHSAKNAGWITVLLMGVFALIPVLFLLKVLSLYRERNLYEILVKLFGKFFGKMVALILLIFGFAAIVVDASVYTDILSTMYFMKTPVVMIYIVLFLVAGYGAKRGLEQIGSVAWLTFFYVLVCFYTVLILIWKDGIPQLIFPLWGPGIGEVFKTGAKNMSIFMDLFIIGLIAPMVTSFKAYKKGTLFALGLITVEFSFSLMVFVMLFDFTSVEFLRYPFHESLRYISLGFLPNTETLFLPIWLIATFVRFAVYLYLIVLLLGGLLNIKEFEYLVPIISVLVILCGQLPNAPLFTIPNLKEQLMSYMSPVFFLLPVFMWLAAKLKGEFKNEPAIKNN